MCSQYALHCTQADTLVGTGVGVKAFTSDVGPDGLPAWFKPQLFLEPAFDADAYVADLRRFVRNRSPRHLHHPLLHPQTPSLQPLPVQCGLH